MTRRMLALGLAAGVVMAAGLPASAGPTPERRVTAKYQGSGTDGVGPVYAFYVTAYPQGEQTGSVTFPTRGSDRTVSVALKNDRGLRVLAAVVQNGETYSDDVELGRVCGKSEKPFRLTSPGRPLTVYLLIGRCGGSVSVPTTGTAELVFHGK